MSVFEGTDRESSTFLLKNRSWWLLWAPAGIVGRCVGGFVAACEHRYATKRSRVGDNPLPCGLTACVTLGDRSADVIKFGDFTHSSRWGRWDLIPWLRLSWCVIN